MTFDRFGIRGKLNLLLALPLAAVILVAVPLFLARVGTAQSAGSTADVARHASRLATLVSELQRERLITAGYLASPDADGVELLIQQQAVIDTAAVIRAELGADASDEIVGALNRVGSLQSLRQNILRRGVAIDSVVRTFQAVIESVIDSLRLPVQRGADADGARQLAALDAVLRASEQSTLRAMALVAAATTPETGLALLADASEEFDHILDPFVHTASREQTSLVVLVDQGETARRLDALVTRVPETWESDVDRDAFIAEVLTVAEAQAGLRRVALEQVTGDIAAAAAARASNARSAAWLFGLGTGALVTVAIALALVISRSIANPLQELTVAAATTADLANAELTRVSDVESIDEQPPRLSRIDVSTGHEVGALAAAFNRVQATAAMLLERQLVSRRNVSLMFANVAQRTQNLVTRQLAVVDRLERDEQDAQILAGLYQIDHISTRLRRTSDNLLVIAGARDNAKIAGPATLAAILRSAVAEIEDYQRIRFDEILDVVVSPALVSDLVLVFAELLENATAFSPPQSFVDVDAAQDADWSCLVRIRDHGIGMEPERLTEENRRLVDRERLDVAPTSALGLFVVGRLARRHGLRVELSPTHHGGVSATVAIPPTMIIAGVTAPPANTVRVPAPRSAIESAAAAPQKPGRVVVLPDVSRADFSWFTAEREDERGDRILRAGAAIPVQAASQEFAHGLSRRIPGAFANSTSEAIGDQRSGRAQPAAQPMRNPAAARTAMNDYQLAVGRASGTAAVPLPTQPPAASSVSDHGLVRRVPGENLAPGLRDQHPMTAARPDGARRARDADASRTAFEGYVDGLSRAAEHSSQQTAHVNDYPR